MSNINIETKNGVVIAKELMITDSMTWKSGQQDLKLAIFSLFIQKMKARIAWQ